MKCSVLPLLLAIAAFPSAAAAKDYYVMCGAEGKDGYVMSATFSYDSSRIKDQKKKFKEYIVGNHPNMAFDSFIGGKDIGSVCYQQDATSLNDATVKIKARLAEYAKSFETVRANHVIYTDWTPAK